MTSTKAKPLTPGQRRHLRVSDHVVIYVQRPTAADVWRVWVEQGTANIPEGWEGTYPTVEQARTAFKHAANAFRAHRTAQGIDRRAAELAATINYWEQRQLRRQGVDQTALDSARREADTLMPLGLVAKLAQHRAELDAYYPTAA